MKKVHVFVLSLCLWATEACFFATHRKPFFSHSIADDKAMIPAYLSPFNFSWSLSVLKRGLWGWWWARSKLITCFSERAVACRFYQLCCQDPRYFNLIGFNEGEDGSCVSLRVFTFKCVCMHATASIQSHLSAWSFLSAFQLENDSLDSITPNSRCPNVCHC